jgi:hypothetical protein
LFVADDSLYRRVVLVSSESKIRAICAAHEPQGEILRRSLALSLE